MVYYGFTHIVSFFMVVVLYVGHIFGMTEFVRSVALLTNGRDHQSFSDLQIILEYTGCEFSHNESWSLCKQHSVAINAGQTRNSPQVQTIYGYHSDLSILSCLDQASTSLPPYITHDPENMVQRGMKTRENTMVLGLFGIINIHRHL